MPIVASEIKMYLSGGAGNTDVNASLGGVKSSTEVTTATLHNLFDQVASAESSSGDVEYRCVYVENTNGTLTLENAVAFVATNTPSADTDIAIGVGTAAIDATEQTVADESTAPTGVTFSAPSSAGSGLALGNLAAGEHKALWIRRTVSASASAYSNDSATITISGDTAA